MSEYVAWWRGKNTERSGVQHLCVPIEGQREVRLYVRSGVFDPDPELTHSSASVLERIPEVAGKQVLDLGCGCGVLGLAAAARGAAHVVCVDEQNVAVRNARENRDLLVREKRIAPGVVEIKEGSFFDFDGAKNRVGVKNGFDLILANLDIRETQRHGAQVPQVAFINRVAPYLALDGQVLLTYASFGSHLPEIYRAQMASSLKWTKMTWARHGVTWILFQGHLVA